jgi:hypothetical protein
MGIGEERRRSCRFKSFSGIGHRSRSEDFQAYTHKKIKSKNGKNDRPKNTNKKHQCIK